LYPSVSPNVLAVGGTTLTLNVDGSYGSEMGWSRSTGGFSADEREPSYQTSTLQSVGLSHGVRTTPDVSFNAGSPLAIYDSVGSGGPSGWFQLVGTSAAAPAWAGLIAITDQGLAAEGKGPLSTTQLLVELYSLPSSDFRDVTSGSNGAYSAGTGYDLVTGRGTPTANVLVPDLVADDDTVVLAQAVENKRHRVTEIVVDFSGRVNAAQADSVATYRLTKANSKGAFTARNSPVLGLRSAAFNPANDAVTLIPAKAFTFSRPVELTIYGLAGPTTVVPILRPSVTLNSVALAAARGTWHAHHAPHVIKRSTPSPVPHDWGADHAHSGTPRGMNACGSSVIQQVCLSWRGFNRARRPV
jgi:hypothetical protein